MKIKSFVFSLVLSLVTVNFLSVSHDAVHFFHADENQERLENAYNPGQVHTHTHSVTDEEELHHEHSFELGGFFCDLFDEVAHSAFVIFSFTVELLWLAAVTLLTPLLVTVYSAAFYPNFWGRAPPVFSSI
ncbi:hypothetical protein [Thiomicrorhabdus hydrogeniphila]